MTYCLMLGLESQGHQVDSQGNPCARAAVRRYLEEYELNGSGWSTASVVVTKNERFAWFVHNKALGTGGTSHIYEGRQLDDEPRARARNGILHMEEAEK